MGATLGEQGCLGGPVVYLPTFPRNHIELPRGTL